MNKKLKWTLIIVGGLAVLFLGARVLGRGKKTEKVETAKAGRREGVVFSYRMAFVPQK